MESQKLNQDGNLLFNSSNIVNKWLPRFSLKTLQKYLLNADNIYLPALEFNELYSITKKISRVTSGLMCILCGYIMYLSEYEQEITFVKEDQDQEENEYNDKHRQNMINFAKLYILIDDAFDNNKYNKRIRDNIKQLWDEMTSTLHSNCIQCCIDALQVEMSTPSIQSRSNKDRQNDSLLNIALKKGGFTTRAISSLFSDKGIPHPASKQPGEIIQLIDDIFDREDDIRDGIYTIATESDCNELVVMVIKMIDEMDPIYTLMKPLLMMFLAFIVIHKELKTSSYFSDIII